MLQVEMVGAAAWAVRALAAELAAELAAGTAVGTAVATIQAAQTVRALWARHVPVRKIRSKAQRVAKRASAGAGNVCSTPATGAGCVGFVLRPLSSVWAMMSVRTIRSASQALNAVNVPAIRARPLCVSRVAPKTRVPRTWSVGPIFAVFRSLATEGSAVRILSMFARRNDLTRTLMVVRPHYVTVRKIAKSNKCALPSAMVPRSTVAPSRTVRPTAPLVQLGFIAIPRS